MPYAVLTRTTASACAPMRTFLIFILLFLLYHLLHHVYFVYLAALDGFNGVTQILHDSHVIQLIAIIEEFQKRNNLFLRSLGHLLARFHSMPL